MQHITALANTIIQQKTVLFCRENELRLPKAELKTVFEETACPYLQVYWVSANLSRLLQPAFWQNSSIPQSISWNAIYRLRNLSVKSKKEKIGSTFLYIKNAAASVLLKSRSSSIKITAALYLIKILIHHILHSLHSFFDINHTGYDILCHRSQYIQKTFFIKWS